MRINKPVIVIVFESLQFSPAALYPAIKTFAGRRNIDDDLSRFQIFRWSSLLVSVPTLPSVTVPLVSIYKKYLTR